MEGLAGPLVQGFTGIAFGNMMADNFMQVSEVEKGKHPVASALYQIAETQISFNFLTQVVGGMSNWIVVPVQFLIMGAVGGLHYASQMKETDERTGEVVRDAGTGEEKYYFSKEARERIELITECITPVVQIANVIGVIALFVLGNYVMGGAVLAMYGFALLDHYELMPEFAQKVYYTIIRNELFLAIGACFITQGLAFVICAAFLAIRVGIMVERYFFAEKAHARSLLDLSEKGKLTPELFGRMTEDRVALAIDHEAIYRTVPDYKGRVPEIDYKQVIMALFQEKKEGMRRVITQKMRGDEIGQSARGEQDPMEKATVGLEKLLTQINKHSFNAGVSPDYDILERQLKIIAQYLVDNKETKPAFVEDCLIKLAIDAGGYCQAKALPNVRKVYREIVTEMLMSTATEPQKVKLQFYQLLATRREQMFQQIFSPEMNPLVGEESSLPGPMQSFMKDYMSNQHMYGSLVALYGDSFGLESTGAEDDVVAQKVTVDPGLWLQQKIIKFCLGKDLTELFGELFKEDYTAERLPDYLLDAFSSENQGLSEVILFWARGFAAEHKMNEDDLLEQVQELLKYKDSDLLKRLRSNDLRQASHDKRVVDQAVTDLYDPETQSALQERLLPEWKALWAAQAAENLCVPGTPSAEKAAKRVNACEKKVIQALTEFDSQADVVNDLQTAWHRQWLAERELEKVNSNIHAEENRLRAPGEKKLLNMMLVDMGILREETAEDRAAARRGVFSGGVVGGLLGALEDDPEPVLI